MITNILNAYRFKSKLQRVPFLVGFLLLVGIGSVAISHIHSSWIDQTVTDADYLLWVILVQFAIALLFLPLCIGRLRDLGWSPYLVLLVLVPSFIDPKIAVWLAHQNEGTFPMPTAVVYLAPILVTAYLVLLLLLFLWPARAVLDTE